MQEEELPPIVSKSMPGTMVLVIGIILGAFVAMILIVIIVLKIRVRVDGNIKCEEPSAAPRYQFAPPNDYGEVAGEQETATTSLMEASVAPHSGPMPPGPPGGIRPPGGVTGGPPGGPARPPGGPPGPMLQRGPANNGVFNNNCPPPHPGGVPPMGHPGVTGPLHPGGTGPLPQNGDRSRLFRKANGSKPVREWYV